MPVWKALILGILQGLAEFLPVSSSGHLVLAQRVMGIEGDMLFLDTMLHLGTLAAVFIVMWKEIWAILKKPIQNITWYVILATLPIVGATVVFGDFFEKAFGGGLLGIGFLLTSVILFIMPFVKRGNVDMHTMGWKRSLIIGASQVVAVFPGVSRSGTTIFAGKAVGLDESRASFAFLLSIPAILGSVVWQFKDVAQEGTAALTAVPWESVLVGVLAAAVTGYFAMKLLMDMVRKGKLWYFGIYTAVLGLLVVLDQYALHIFF